MVAEMQAGVTPVVLVGEVRAEVVWVVVEVVGVEVEKQRPFQEVVMALVVMVREEQKVEAKAGHTAAACTSHQAC
jgi:hypothetical protein